jgi:Na+-driven multidrug efflux pump
MDIIHSDNLRRTVVQLAWPAVLRLFLNMIVQVVDTAMVGSLGAIALAAYIYAD